MSQIEEKKFEDAPAVNHNDTNTTLAKRDYEQKCRYPHKIGVVHGIWIWWCDTHYQPLFICDAARVKEKTLAFAEAVKLTDKTEPYEYGGCGYKEKSENNRGEQPAQWTRWLTPREIALNFIRDLTR